MTTTSRGKTTSRRTAPVRRRKKNTLGQFMLWAFISWVLAKTGHTRPMNPYARPSDRRPARRGGPRGGGGGGGGGGHGAGTPAGRGPVQKKAPLDPEPKEPMYRPGAGGDEIEVDVIDDVPDEDVELIDEDEPDDDTVDGEVLPQAEIGAAD